MKMRKLVTMLMVVCLMVGLLAVPAGAAQTNNQSQRWNIMLVVDGSGSLISHVTSDPNGLRYQAINSIIDSLHGSGNNVGAIVFNGTKSDSDSDDAMMKGIALNTGLMAMDNDSNKNELKRMIEEKYVSYDPDTGTDIGTALLLAQQELSAMDNGLPNIIFLFTDGLTDIKYEKARNKSLENKATAIENIRAEGIALCGVFLNKNNYFTDATEVKEIVAECLGTNSSNLGEYYVELNTSADINNATLAFLKCLNIAPIYDPAIIDDPGSGSIVTYDLIDENIRVPGVGIEEINFYLYTESGEHFPEDSHIVITKPDGHPLSAGELAAVTYAGDTYRIYKIVAPESGTWNFYAKFPEGNRVAIEYNPTISTYIDTAMEVTPASSELHVNSNVTVTAYLQQGGVKLTDSASYREYECILEMTNVTTGGVTTKTITPNANNSYELPMVLQEYGIFDVRTYFICDKVKVEAQKQTWDLTNRAPECSGSGKVSEMYGLFLGNDKTVDLTADTYGIFDTEDSFADLTLTIDGGTCDLAGMSINNGVLAYDASNSGSGTVIVTITDTQGASTTLTLDLSVKSMTLTLILIAIAIVLLIVIIIILRIRSINGVVTDGTCAITIWVPNGNTGAGQNICVNDLTPPGQNSPSKQSLYDLLERDLKSAANEGFDSSRAKRACMDNRVPFEDFTRVVDEIAPDLKRATVKRIIYKDKELKRKSGNRMKFQYKNTKDTLRSGSRVTINIEGIPVSFTYSAKGQAGGEGRKTTNFGAGGFGGDSNNAGFGGGSNNGSFSGGSNNGGFSGGSGNGGFGGGSSDSGFGGGSNNGGFGGGSSDSGFGGGSGNGGFGGGSSDGGFGGGSGNGGFGGGSGNGGFGGGSSDGGFGGGSGNGGFGGDSTSGGFGGFGCFGG